MTGTFKHTVALSVLPALLLAGCGSSDDGPPPPSGALVSVKQEASATEVAAGDRVTWTVTATNEGTGATPGVVTLVSTVPANVTGASVVANGASCGPVLSTVTCTIPAGLAAGSSASVVLSATASTAGTLTSTVTPSGTDVKGCAAAEDCTSTTKVTAGGPVAKVGVSASVDKTSAVINENIKWTLSVANTGDAATSAATTLTNTFAPANAIGTPTVTGTGNATCGTINAGVLTCTIPAGLAAKTGVAKIEITAPAAAAGTLTNTVTATGATCATAADCKTTTTVTAAAAANVTVSSSVDKTSAAIGDTVKWTISAVNSGTAATAAPITLTNTLPSSGIGSATVESTNGMSCNAQTGATITCTVPVGLAAGATATAVISATTSAAGSLAYKVEPGTGASCTSAANCTNTTTVTSGGSTPTKVAGSCGEMIDAATLNSVFGGSNPSSMITGLAFLGSTATGAEPPFDLPYFAAKQSKSTDAVNLESYPGDSSTTNGPTNGGVMVESSGKQFICMSQNGDGTTSGATGATKYSSTAQSVATTGPIGNITISKGAAIGKPGGFVSFNLPSLTDFSIQFYSSGGRAYTIEYTVDGKKWIQIFDQKSAKSGTWNESNVLTTAKVAPITTPVVLRVRNDGVAGTNGALSGGGLTIQGLMIQP